MLWEAMGRVGLERPSFNHVLLHRSLFMRWYQEVGPQATSPLGQYINFFPPLPSPHPASCPVQHCWLPALLGGWERGAGAGSGSGGPGVVRSQCHAAHTPEPAPVHLGGTSAVCNMRCREEWRAAQTDRCVHRAPLATHISSPVHLCVCGGGRAESAKQPRQGTWVGSDIAVQVLASAPPSSAAPPTGGSGGPP